MQNFQLTRKNFNLRKKLQKIRIITKNNHKEQLQRKKFEILGIPSKGGGDNLKYH